MSMTMPTITEQEKEALLLLIAETKEMAKVAGILSETDGQSAPSEPEASASTTEPTTTNAPSEPADEDLWAGMLEASKQSPMTDEEIMAIFGEDDTEDLMAMKQR